MEKIVHDKFEFEVDSLIPNTDLSEHPRYNRFLSLAKEISLESVFRTNRVGAILVNKGRIIAKGFNSIKSHPLQKFYNNERTDITDSAPHYIHAEIDILKKFKGEDLKGSEMFVYHIGKNGKQKLARPCAACMKAIKNHGIEVIHYSTEDGLATEYISQTQKILVKKAKSLI